MNKEQNSINTQAQQINTSNVGRNNDIDVILVDKLFEEFTKAYAQTKPGQAYPKWFDDQQLRWINNVVKSSQISN